MREAKGKAMLFACKAAVAAVALAAASTVAWAAADEERAMATLKRNNCLKCHGIDKSKKGPSYKKVAEKYRGKADAKQKLLDNVTKEPMVKLEDGTEEKHKAIDTKDPQELDNLFEFILSR